jgi:hypothetical protein
MLCIETICLLIFIQLTKKPALVTKHKVHYCSNKCLTVDITILSLLNPLHILTEIHFNIILPSTFRSVNYLFLWCIETKFHADFSFYSCVLHAPTISYLFINLIITVGASGRVRGRCLASAPSLDFWEKNHNWNKEI